MFREICIYPLMSLDFQKSAKRRSWVLWVLRQKALYSHLFFTLFWFCFTFTWPSMVRTKVHKLLSQSSITWTFIISVTGKENEEECQREGKWVFQHWSCVTSCRYFPIVPLESFSTMLHIRREGSATTF